MRQKNQTPKINDEYIFLFLFSSTLDLNNNTITTMKENISPILLNFPQLTTETVEVQQIDLDTGEPVTKF